MMVNIEDYMTCSKTSLDPGSTSSSHGYQYGDGAAFIKVLMAVSIFLVGWNISSNLNLDPHIVES